MAVEPIIGTEVEYGIAVQRDPEFNPVTASGIVVNSYHGGRARIRWSYDDETPGRDARGFTVSTYPVDETDSGLVNAVLTNGARLYVDHAHPEYSTPECVDPLEATLHDKAGEWVMREAAEASRSMFEDGAGIVLHKNNSDGKGNSYGAHENYLVSRGVPFGQIVSHMTAFFVSRQILTGTGKIGAENGRQEASYQITQRADFFEEEIGLETTLKRPIINTRDEPHADSSRYRRLHVINADASRSEVQTLVKLGAASILLMAIEDEQVNDAIRLEDPVAAMQLVSRDLTGKVGLTCTDGQRRSAIDLQWHYFAIAEDYVAGNTLAPAYKRVIAEWRDLLEDFEKGWQYVRDRLDWAAKLALIEGYRRRDGLDWSDGKLSAVGLQFHDVDPAKGLYDRLMAAGAMRRLFEPQEIERAMHTPPEGTRAWFRGESLRRYPDAVVSANWDSLVFDTGESTLVRLPMIEPRRGSRNLVEDLFDQSPDAATLLELIGASDE